MDDQSVFLKLFKLQHSCTLLSSMSPVMKSLFGSLDILSILITMMSPIMAHFEKKNKFEDGMLDLVSYGLYYLTIPQILVPNLCTYIH